MMQPEAIPYSIGLSLLGLATIGMGLWITLGINRYWWQWRILSSQEGYFWASIPAGSALIFWAIGAPLPQNSVAQDIFFWGGVLLIFVGIIFSLSPPRFLKPEWLRDLEDRHPGYTRYLRERARQLSGEEWLTIVHDPERLEQWADAEVNRLIQEQ